VACDLRDFGFRIALFRVVNLVPMHSGLRIIYRIEAARTGPGVARGIVTAELCDHVRSSRKLEEIRLLVSEIVTHRVRQSSKPRMITLDLRADRVVRCGVIDDGPAVLPAGLVLELVERLAGRWGVTRSRKQTHTWIETDAGSISPETEGA
jgi:hypothetical protein